MISKKTGRRLSIFGSRTPAEQAQVAADELKQESSFTVETDSSRGETLENDEFWTNI